MSNTFISINPMFLSSLGVTSWIILCYLEIIEETKKIYIYMDQGSEQGPEIPTIAPEQYQHSYDMYITVLCILAGIYVVFKIAHFAKNYVVFMRSIFGWSGKGGVDSNEPAAIDDFRSKLDNLLLQTEKLEKDNAELLERLHSNFERELTGADDDASRALKQQQNIFISNLHMNRNTLFVNEGNDLLETRGCAKGDTANDSGQIWRKYLELQKLAIQPELVASNSSTAVLSALGDADRTVGDALTPTVMSITDVQKTRGLY